MITRKYTTALLVLTLILGAYYLHTSDLRLQRLTEQYAQESASILDQQLQTFKLHLRDIVSDLRFIAEQQTLKRFLAGEHPAMEALKADLLTFAARKQHLYNQLFLVGPDGRDIIRIDNRNDAPAIISPGDPPYPEQRHPYMESAALDPGTTHLALLSPDPEGNTQPASRAMTLRLATPISGNHQECRYLVKDFGTSQSPKSTRQRDSRYCPDRPALITTPSRTLQQSCSCAT
ncbi:MAG: hypothetical protein B0D96_13495, partial [Candidatus Sedimenticola endophacoides]